MWKNFLKTFVSLFVLLGALSTLTPSQAMEKDENEKTSLTRRKFKQDEKGDGLFSIFPEEVTQTILLYLNPKELPLVATVCQKWQRLTLNDEKFVKDIFEKNKQNPALLEQLISCSPRFISFVDNYFEELALLYPLQLVSLEKKFEIELIPETITDFASAVRKSSPYHPFLIEKIIALDPLDAQKVAFAFHIVKGYPELQDQLRKAVNKFNVKLSFRELIENIKNHSSFQKYLMVLKLLTSTGDIDARGKYQKFADDLCILLHYRCHNIMKAKAIELNREMENGTNSESNSESESENDNDENEIGQELINEWGRNSENESDGDEETAQELINESGRNSENESDGDEETAQELINEWGRNSENESDEDAINPEFVYLTTEPFWSAFTDNPQAHENELKIASKIMKSSVSKSLDVEKYNKFSAYVFTVFPSLLSTSSVVSLYEGIGKICKSQGRRAEQLASVNKLYAIMDKKNLSIVLDVVDLYVELGAYDKALGVLENAYKHVGKEAIRFIFQRNMAHCILNLQLKERFSEARTYLDSLLTQFPENENLLTVPYQVAFEERKHKVDVSIKFSNKFIYSLKSVLHIFENQFKEAYECLLKGEKGIDGSILQAVKTQLHNPELQKARNLVQLLADKMEQMTLPYLLKVTYEASPEENIFWLGYFKPYEEVVNFLLQNHPEARKKFKEIMASLKSSIAKKEDKS